MKRGIELGINADLSSIKEAAKISNENNMDYFFVPETNPSIIGVDAFDTLEKIADKNQNMIMGTGIVNVFSRTKEQIAAGANKIYEKCEKKFVLGIGTSAPAVIENMWRLKFEKPVSRILEYTEYLRSNFQGPIFWAAVGQKTTQLAAQKADGVMFFLKPKRQVASDVSKIKSKSGSFETVCIVPTYFGSGFAKAKKTLARYIGANEFYSVPLMSEYDKEILEIRKAFRKFGLSSAIEEVSDKLAEELAICGTPKYCKERLDDFQEKTGCDAVIAGFDLDKDRFDSEFFENLKKLLAVM